jgi:hypothetical protein
MRAQELLFLGLAGTRVRMELDRVPLWRGDHVEVRQLVDDFARYLYLPRLRSSDVLRSGLEDGLGLLLWRDESFAYADSYDDGRERYLGLRGGERINLSAHEHGLIVQSAVALKQMEADAADAKGSLDEGAKTGASTSRPEPGAGEGPAAPTHPTRFFGTVTLDAGRVGRDAGRIADEVIAHLAGLVDARVVVSLEIEAEVPEGVPENVVRTVSENARTLNFSSQGFERD